MALCAVVLQGPADQGAGGTGLARGRAQQSQFFHAASTVEVPILQMRKLSPREVKPPFYGEESGKWTLKSVNIGNVKMFKNSTQFSHQIIVMRRKGGQE